MIKIAICDDEEKELNRTFQMFSSFKENHAELDIKISLYKSAVELNQIITIQEHYDILLLDIYMPEMSGTHLARILREQKEECRIIFLTSSQAHAIEAFSLHADHYLVKPYTFEQFEDALTKTIASIDKRKNSQIILKVSGGILRVELNDILYSETDKHNQKLYLIDSKCVQVRIASGELYEMLSSDPRFFKCGTTYILNLDKIKAVTSRFILLDDGNKIPMQRRQYRELLDRFTSYSFGGY